ncbi:MULTISPECIES: nickel-dependent hydrogenase large subunit [unclassified Nocardioides]|uniref:nickel-dependent hydrogenase large subunit n=1 Tax=unclassified Nocardioides TaxID=2615069 RepID=UPI0006F8764F|nr:MULTISPECIES: nickel-dependent hydrogenase large subunit [unclassified Nocardioides]KRA27976.1 cytochrome-c3 hydrogenase [Nocardioides sp. Root614]KRA85950.1 cytochrome-c3 hydrogenase [Nocardioides sp. Root682]
MTSTDLFVSPLGRVEGDLDVRVTITDGVVTDAWTEAAMFRGFEMILKGKDPQAGLIVTPRICGICGGSHLYKACYALDTAWKTHVPENATLVRNIAQACETLQSIPRYFYALFAVDLVNKNYAKSKLYDECVRRFAPYVGTAYQKGVVLSNKPVEVYALFGGQWPHSSFMVPGGVMSAPSLVDITRATAILNHWRDNWLEAEWLGCSIDRWLEVQTWEDMLAWVEENESQYNSDCGFFIRFCLDVGLHKYGGGVGNFIASGTYFEPSLYDHPTPEGRNAALIGRSGIYADGKHYEYDHLRVSEDVSHSYFKGDRPLHPWEGETIPLDVAEARKAGKYSWAKSPRYDVPDLGRVPLEAGPLARRMAAGNPDRAAHQDYDPLFIDMMAKLGPSVFVRQMARMHEAPKYLKWVMDWLSKIDLHGSFYTKPEEPSSGKGFGATEAARGSLQDWIVIEDGKIENYQVVTPTAWNIGPRDSNSTSGPIESALIGSPIVDIEDPVELGHVARSFDSCLVCTVHAYDGKTGRELNKFVVNGMV